MRAFFAIQSYKIAPSPRQMANDTQYDVDDVYKENGLSPRFFSKLKFSGRWDDGHFMDW